MKICFYNVDLSYIDYLKKYESEKKGYTRVPNVQYKSGNNKFFWLIPIHPLLTNTRLFSIIHRNAKFSKTRIRCNKKMCLFHFRYDAQKCMF